VKHSLDVLEAEVDRNQFESPQEALRDGLNDNMSAEPTELREIVCSQQELKEVKVTNAAVNLKKLLVWMIKTKEIVEMKK
jgi:hypothetical protein